MNPIDDRTHKHVDETGKDSEVEAAANQPRGVGDPITDQPPIIIGNGSLFMDLPLDKELDLVTATATGPRPVRYKQKGIPSIDALGQVQALILKPLPSNLLEFYTHPISKDKNAQLHIWLAEINAAGTAFVPVDPINPQIVIAGSPFTIEVDRQLVGPSKNFKSKVPLRYRHPGYTGRFFRIDKWDIIDMTGSSGVLHTRTGDDDYILHATFHH